MYSLVVIGDGEIDLTSLVVHYCPSRNRYRPVTD